MTKQIKEIVVYKNEEYGVNDTPLDPYMDRIVEKKIDILLCTDCWRGYRGYWEIRDDKLYLNQLEERGVFFDFPSCSDLDIFAGWYSGEINIPTGKEIKCNFRDEPHNHEEYLVLEFKNGVLQNSRIRDNRGYKGSLPDQFS